MDKKHVDEVHEDQNEPDYVRNILENIKLYIDFLNKTSKTFISKEKYEELIQIAGEINGIFKRK